MLFQEDLIHKIIAGDKTQTRRLIKDGETLAEIDGLKTVLTASGRIKWQQDRDYAVQYGRGKPMCWVGQFPNNEYQLIPYDLYLKKRGHGDTDEDFLAKHWYPLRIKVLDIRESDARHISLWDAHQEGFPKFHSHIPFWKVWTKFYDKPAHRQINQTRFLVVSHIKDMLLERPKKHYHAWALTFEIKGTWT